MTFMGKDIPQPSSLEKIRVDLTQDADPPQNISALNFVSPDSPGIGRLTFQLSNPSEMVKTMEDNYSVKVSMDGKEILKTSYKEGNKAREFLQQCLAGHSAQQLHSLLHRFANRVCASQPHTVLIAPRIGKHASRCGAYTLLQRLGEQA